MSITVLLATHNSEKYLKEQMESLINQTYRDIFICISDDFSTDGTLDIIQEFLEKYSNISLVKSETPLKSPQANFWFLLKNAPEADYYMFCDHDDVWLPKKIEKTLKKMEATEGKNLPVLVHSDLFVVDTHLNIISESMFSMQKLSKNRTLAQTLIQNNVTGCTAMINHSLKSLAMKKSDTKNMLMHDWYLAILALVFGKIGFVDEPLIYYRQHGNNEVGAKDARTVSYNVQKLSAGEKNRESLEKTFRQAKDIAQIFDLGQHRNLVEEYAALSDKNKLGRIASCIKHGFWKNTLARKIGQIMFM